jgi:hypothetical protein
MPGGNCNSSKARVALVFTRLASRTDDWIRTLLTLPECGSAARVDAAVDLRFVSGHWGESEVGLKPPVALLAWLMRDLQAPAKATTITEGRERLVKHDPATIEKALRELEKGENRRGWHVFEGPTYPDAFLETPGALVVVEGKRTEAGPTTSTTWMTRRHQLWRHIDAAWEIRGSRMVYGLFIVEGIPDQPTVVPPHWKVAAEAILKRAAIEGSFPHRSPAERTAIAGGFLGVTTWQAVCDRFGIDFKTLPDTTANLQRQ